MYSDCKIYGPYSYKDNRKRLVLVYNSGMKTSISYPKYLIEVSIGRYLNADEQIHHLDGDVNNNDLSNLEIVKSGEHQKQHNPLLHIEDKKEICVWCKNTFKMSVQHQRHRSAARTRNKVGPFCSRKCSGEYGKSIQMGTFV